jgi:hypothetical protein
MRNWQVFSPKSLINANNQPAPPASLSSILESFRKSGEGDRDLLLSILGAKKAEEEVSLFSLKKYQVLTL